MTCWTHHDFDGYVEYDKVVAHLKIAQSDGIPETLRKEFHVDDKDDGGEGPHSLLFLSEVEVKRAISQARRHDYIRYVVKGFEIGAQKMAETSDSNSNLVPYPMIVIVFADEAVEKEFREAFRQISDSSMNQFFLPLRQKKKARRS